MKEGVKEVLFSEEDISIRTKELAKIIDEDYKGKELLSFIDSMLDTNFSVSDEELKKRREKLKPFELKCNSGYLAKYAKNVQDASHGAIV